MKKVILFMAGILASMMLNAQSRWSVTPEAGLVVNKENEGTSVTLGFKAGAGVLYQLKEGVGKKPSFGLKSGVYILMQKGGYQQGEDLAWIMKKRMLSPRVIICNCLLWLIGVLNFVMMCVLN